MLPASIIVAYQIMLSRLYALQFQIILTMMIQKEQKYEQKLSQTMDINNLT
jgi:hypothetical protein